MVSVVRRTACLLLVMLLAACAVRVPPPVTLPQPDVASARETAVVMGAVGTYGRVLFTHRMIDDQRWPDRVRMLAHELVHSLQYELTGGIRGTSEQWLREGFAEWVALMTVDTLGGPALQDLRDQQWALFQASSRSRAPRLDDMVTFAQWVPLSSRRDIALYSQAFLVVDMLVERHGAPAIIEYFRRFANTRDRHAAFRTVFGETQTGRRATGHPLTLTA